MPKIFESPDGGHTVYARESGSSQRVLVETNKLDSRTWDGRPLHEHIQENQMWGEIRRAAHTNPALQEALDRAIMIYQLSKES